MKKRMIWCLLASMIVVSFLVAGCSKSNSTASNPPASTPSSSSSNPTASTPSQPSGSQWIADLFTKLKSGSFKADFIDNTLTGATTSGTMWKQDDSMKMATTIKGNAMVIIINYADKTMISYRPDTEKGYKMALPAEYASQNMSNYWNNVDLTTVKDLGTQSINGETCHGVQYPATLYGFPDTVKIWLDANLDFPVQIITTTPSGETATMNFKNVQLSPLPSDTFSVPAGITIKDMTSAS